MSKKQSERMLEVWASRSPEERKRLGQRHSRKLKGKMVGKKNPFYGHKHTRASKDKMSSLAIGREVSASTRKKVSIRSRHCWRDKKYRASTIRRQIAGRKKSARARVGRKRRICLCGCRQKVPNSFRYSYVRGHAPQATKIKSLWASKEYRDRQLETRNSAQTFEKKRKVMLKVWSRSGYRKRLSNLARLAMKGKMTDPAFVERMRETGRKGFIAHLRNVARDGVLKVPNASEKKLWKLLEKDFPGEFKLNVKGGVVISGRTPDFVSESRKLVVELLGDYWHGKRLTGRTKKQSEWRRRSHFAKFGFRTCTVWEKELKHSDKVVKKIRRYLE